MKQRHLMLISLIALLMAMGCNRDKVTVTNFDPQGEVKDLQSFTITFSHDLAPDDKQNEWLTESFVTFKPEITGRFKWLNANTLLFSPDRPLDASQDYSAKVDKAVLFGKQLSLDGGSYSFNTAHFEATGVNIFWEPLEGKDHRLKVAANVNFSHDVSPDELRSHIEVTKDGKKFTDFQVTTGSASRELGIDFGEVAQSDKYQEFEVTLKKGLTSTIGRSPLTGDRKFSTKLPPIELLAITGATSGYDGKNAWIEIITTQVASDTRIGDYIEITPKPKGMKVKVDRNKIRITGDMTSGNEYNLKVKKGLAGLYGGKLTDDFSQTLAIADLEPKLKFADKGLYLLKGGEQNLNIEAVNIENAKVQVYEVFKNNLLFFFYNNYNYNELYYSQDNSYYNRYGQNYDINYYGKQLYQEEVKFKDLNNMQQNHTVNLDKALNQKYKGIYMVSVRSDQDYWLNDARLVAISDIGLITKYNGDELWVFANSLKTASPVAGAEVKLISQNNQELQSGVTGVDGVVRFKNIKKENEGFSPALLTAELGDDFNFLDIRSARVETSRYDIGGKYISPDGFNAFLYGDRNIYRPGETAYISGIVRGLDMSFSTGEPMVLKVRNPRGKDFETFKKELNQQGSFEVAVNLPDFAQTGQYVAELYAGDDTYISSYRFSVEEFVPDKIRVSLDTDKEVVEMGKSLNIEISSEYLFGAPAAEHKYEMDVRLRHNYFSSKAYPKFSFGGSSIKNSSLSNDFYEGTLDANGKATQEYTLPGEIKSRGYLSGNATVSVFDVTGRTVNRSVSFKAFPNDYFIGIRSEGYYYNSIDDDQRYQFIAVDENDKPIANFPMDIELIRHEWKTVLKKVNDGGRYRYQSEKKEIKEWKKSITLNGAPTDYKFKVDYSGEYELRVSKKGSSDYNSTRFYAYSYGRSSASSFEIDKEGRVEIILDKEKYAPGEKAKVLFVTPFTGKMLVTIERENVMKHMYVDVVKNSTELTLDVGSEQIPNAYISATLFRPHSAENSGPFLVGHGYAPIMVESEGDKLPVTIIAPEGRVKPRTRQNITIKTIPERDIFVTFAAVDEGILQVKNFQTPDPYASMYAKRSLQVESYDLYKYLFPEIASSSPAGGDEEGARQKRLNPVKAKRFKLLAKWSGILRTNSAGEVKIPLELPQYNGEVRLMAVAYEGRRFGSAEKALTVADDIILQPSVPRFLAIGDSLTIPVSVMNTTAKSGDVKVNMEVTGPMKISSKSSQQVSVSSKGTSTTMFTLVAKEDIGVGKITFTTSGMAEVKEEIEIGVRPISGLVVDGGGGAIKAGETKTVTISSDYIPATQHSGMSVSAFPAVEFGRQLRGLVGYPHGCLEQTTSKVFPQLYLADIANLVAPEVYKDGNPQYYVKQGILKLQGMVLNDGSFSYWPGYNRYHWWGTAYATHFLVEAKKAGYQVDEGTMEKALDFLTRKVADRSTYEYAYWESGSWKKKRIANKETIYSLYVLALAGRPEVSFMNFYRGKPNLLSLDTRYLLAGAFALSKNYTAFNELIPQSNAFVSEKSQRTSGGTFDSELRANALMLNVLLDTDPQNAQIPGMVRYLKDALPRSYSTQERAWAFLALGKLARKAANSDVKIEAIVDGKTVHTFSGKHDAFNSDAFNGKTVTLKATGTGETFFYWNTEGVKAKGVAKNEDLNLKVRRNYYDRNGNAILNGNFSQGDLIVCGISLTGGARSVPNIAITDLIPSGFEIENPRLNTSADLAWTEGRGARMSTDYMDVRDDRLVLFTTASANKTQTYYYMLRVINTGTFQLPAIGAESMYDPDYRSYHGAGVVRVRK